MQMKEGSKQAMVKGSVNFNVHLDVFSIGNGISNAIITSQNRPGFVKNLMHTASFQLPNYNVMVFNLSQEYEPRLKGIVFYGSAVYQRRITFGIWAFESGEFINKGDGGWINWAFTGNFERNGGYVKFHKMQTKPVKIIDLERAENRNTPVWTIGESYSLGQRVAFRSNVYECIQAHTAHVENWTPDLVPSLWKRIS
jgi:hypothetical protein